MNTERYLTIEDAALELANVIVNDNDIRDDMATYSIPEKDFGDIKMSAIKSRQKICIELLNNAIKQSKILVREPNSKLPYTPQTERIFYEVMSVRDINPFLDKSGVEYRLDTQDETGSKQQFKREKLSVLRGQEITRVIRELRFDPLNMPPFPPGKAGIKADVRKELKKQQSKLFSFGNDFNRAWQQLLDDTIIAYQKK